MKVSKRSFRQKNPVSLIPHWRKGSYGGVCFSSYCMSPPVELSLPRRVAYLLGHGCR